ncbi:nudix hydrolase 12, mitochondrial-like [Carex rostrata]
MASPVLARKGRHRQRYDHENYRLVAGCIPYKLKEGMCSLIDRLEVLMISTPNRHDLVFPKGGWENDETIYEAACREVLEEAGIKGIIDKRSLGEWVFRSKSSEMNCSPTSSCKGQVFALEVTDELDSWAEQSSHIRRWVPVMDAYGLCRYDWMREALDSFLDLLSGQKNTVTSEASTAPTNQELTPSQDLTTTDLSTICMIQLPTSTERAIALC